jgi:ABC-type polysaccharide/polyol phosphate export permease
MAKSNPRSPAKRASKSPARKAAAKAAPTRVPRNGQKDGKAREDTAGLNEADELLGPATMAQLAEEERLGRKIPRVRALTTEDLGELQPPSKQRYPVRILQKLAELWRARELVYTFVERDLRVRYKQAVLGAFWAIAQPLMLMVVFSVVFGRIANISTDGIEPYAIFSYTALVPFQLFAGSLNYGTSSIVSNWATIRKIYMPREIFPLASVASAGFDFIVSSVILFGMLMVFGYYPRGTWVAYPLLLIVLLIITTSVTMLASMITAYIRDTRYGIPLLIQVLMYATPVAYPLSEARKALPEWLADSYAYVNPLVPVMDGFRTILLKGEWPDWGPLASATGMGLILLMLVYRWYKQVDPNFADVV